jgi:hypothetical protein
MGLSNQDINNPRTSKEVAVADLSKNLEIVFKNPRFERRKSMD